MINRKTKNGIAKSHVHSLSGDMKREVSELRNILIRTVNTLLIVALQQLCRCLTTDDGSKFPAQIIDIMNATIAASGTEWRDNMR